MCLPLFLCGHAVQCLHMCVLAPCIKWMISKRSPGLCAKCRCAYTRFKGPGCLVDANFWNAVAHTSVFAMSNSLPISRFTVFGTLLCMPVCTACLIVLSLAGAQSAGRWRACRFTRRPGEHYADCGVPEWPQEGSQGGSSKKL